VQNGGKLAEGEEDKRRGICPNMFSFKTVFMNHSSVMFNLI
jgi:hypothetical protein